MLRYGIEMAAVAPSAGERLAVDEHVVDGKVDPWRRMLAAAVAHSAGGRVVWAPDGSRSRGKIFFYGPAGAVGGIVGPAARMTTRARPSRASSSRCRGSTSDRSRRDVDARHVA